MRSARGDMSNNLSVGIFSPDSVVSSMPGTAWLPASLPFASFARSAWLVCAERATEKNRNIETEFFDLPNSRLRHGRYRATARVLPCRTWYWPGYAPEPQ